MVTTALGILWLACAGDTTTGDTATASGDSGTTGTSGTPTDTGPAAAIAVEPAQLDLATANAQPVSGAFTVSSTGDATLELTDVAYTTTGSDLPGILVWMTEGMLPISVAPGGTTTLTVEWTPDRPGDDTPLETGLAITSNAAADPVFTVTVTGENGTR